MKRKNDTYLSTDTKLRTKSNIQSIFPFSFTSFNREQPNQLIQNNISFHLLFIFFKIKYTPRANIIKIHIIIYRQ